MNFRKTYTILTITLLLTIISCSDGDSNLELAVFDNGNVLFTDYVDHYLLSTQYKPKKFPTEQNLEEIVELKAIEKMAVIEALAQGVDQDSAYLSIAANNERRLLYQQYVQGHLVNSIVTDSLIQKFYSEYSPQYNMKYIMRPIVNTSSDEFIQLQKDTIETAYKALEQGIEFGKVAYRYSQDKTTNKKGGDLGWIILESMGDHIVRTVMDTLSNNSYSKPFRGYGGYYILYKGEQRDVKTPPIEEIRSQIWKSLYRSRRPYVEDILDQKFDELSKKLNYKLLEDNIEGILTKAGWNSKTSRYRELDFNNLDDKDMQMVVAEYNSGNIILLELFANKKKAPINKLEFDLRLNSISKEHLISLYAKEQNLQDKDELSEQLEEMRTSLLRAMLFKYEVRDKVDKEAEELGVQKNVAKRNEIKTKYQNKYEDYIKEKYNFRFVEKNFANALDLATEKKKEQNLEKSDNK